MKFKKCIGLMLEIEGIFELKEVLNVYKEEFKDCYFG